VRSVPTSLDETTSAVAQAVAPQRPRARWIVVGAFFLASCISLGLLFGPERIPFRSIVEVLWAHVTASPATGVSHVQEAIVWQIRAPRVILAGIVGGTLALAGATYQGVFSNPLADPYLLGAASGAELGATLSIAYAPLAWATSVVPVGAFIGAIAAVAAAVALGRSVRAGRSATVLILAGVAVGSFLTAIETYVEGQHQAAIRMVYTFVLGRLDTAGWSGVRLVIPYVLVAAAVIVVHRRHLDLLSLGDEEAASLGVNVRRTRMLLIASATLGTAAAVSVAGTIGFVGIIVPHTIRLMTRASYRTILPLSLIAGAGFLILADLLARVVIAPGELPIGVITAFVGAPFFVVLLRRSRQVRA
jgi:iron complex transport system permease protein